MITDNSCLVPIRDDVGIVDRPFGQRIPVPLPVLLFVLTSAASSFRPAPRGKNFEKQRSARANVDRVHQSKFSPDLRSVSYRRSVVCSRTTPTCTLAPLAQICTADELVRASKPSSLAASFWCILKTDVTKRTKISIRALALPLSASSR